MSATLVPATFDHTKPHSQMRFWWTRPDMDRDEIHRYSFAGFYSDKHFDEPNRYDGGAQWMRDTLANAWGVTGSLEAHDAVRALLSGADRVETDFVLPLALELVDVPEKAAEAEQLARQQFILDFAEANESSSSRLTEIFRHLVRVLRSDSSAASHAPAVPTTTLAWDILRIEKVGGLSTRLGWISAEDWDLYCEAAVDILRRNFVSWADVAASFWWGRAVWACDSEIDIAKEMQPYSEALGTYLTHPDSPWVRYPLHSDAA